MIKYGNSLCQALQIHNSELTQEMHSYFDKNRVREPPAANSRINSSLPQLISGEVYVQVFDAKVFTLYTYQRNRNVTGLFLEIFASRLPVIPG